MSPPTFSRAGKVEMNVSKIIVRLFDFLNNLNILAILNDLNANVADVPFKSVD
jgi:hypothetical protein